MAIAVIGRTARTVGPAGPAAAAAVVDGGATAAVTVIVTMVPVAAVTATGGFIVLCIPLLLLEIRRIQLADYLPALVIAPAAVWTFLS